MWEVEEYRTGKYVNVEVVHQPDGKRWAGCRLLVRSNSQKVRDERALAKRVAAALNAAAFGNSELK